MSDRPDFTVKVDQNKYLFEGGREAHAIVTVEATGGAPAGVSPDTAAAVVVIIDTSGSMSLPAKLMAAKQAAHAAVDALRDGVRFALVAGSNSARMLYPLEHKLVVAGAETREEAKAAVDRLEAAGGTAMGRWLQFAGDLLDRHQDAIRHAILLTDGKNQHESAEELDETLAACAGRFVCDCRGVGTDWDVAELRKVASAMLGGVDIVADPADLEADFRTMTQAAMDKAVGDVSLRIWTPQGAELRFVKQVLPTVEDLTGKRTEAGPQEGDYPIGSWGVESRDYHLCVEVPSGHVGRELRAAWVKLVAGSGRDAEQPATGNVLAEWTDDEALSTQINPRVAHYTGQQELAAAIQEGLQARKDGDVDTAMARLGRAVVLANESGNEPIAELLGKVVEVVDLETGTVRLREHVDKADEMSLDTRSTRTVPTRKGKG
jgi:hypothetical protein